jgi:hypothetical protein
MVTRTRLIVTLYVNCLSCYVTYWPEDDQNLAETCSLYKPINSCVDGNFMFVYAAINTKVYLSWRAWGGVVVKALRYQSKGPGIDP